MKKVTRRYCVYGYLYVCACVKGGENMGVELLQVFIYYTGGLVQEISCTWGGPFTQPAPPCSPEPSRDVPLPA